MHKQYVNRENIDKRNKNDMSVRKSLGPSVAEPGSHPRKTCCSIRNRNDEENSFFFLEMSALIKSAKNTLNMKDLIPASSLKPLRATSSSVLNPHPHLGCGAHLLATRIFLVNFQNHFQNFHFKN